MSTTARPGAVADPASGHRCASGCSSSASRPFTANPIIRRGAARTSASTAASRRKCSRSRCSRALRMRKLAPCLQPRATASGARLRDACRALPAVEASLPRNPAGSYLRARRDRAPRRHDQGLRVLPQPALESTGGIRRRSPRHPTAPARRPVRHLLRRSRDRVTRSQQSRNSVKDVSEHLSGMSPGFTLVPAIHVFLAAAELARRGCPGQARA